LQEVLSDSETVTAAPAVVATSASQRAMIQKRECIGFSFSGEAPCVVGAAADLPSCGPIGDQAFTGD